MILETERLVLREMTPGDREALRAVISDPETMRYYPEPYNERGVNRWLEWSRENYANFGFGLWAVCLKESGDMIGDCGITMQHIDGWIRPEIGYHINKRFWRQGYAHEAGIAVRDYAFTHTPFCTLYSYMNAENVPSCSTAESLGMTLRGTFTEDGILHRYYAITKEKWKKLQENN